VAGEEQALTPKPPSKKSRQTIVLYTIAFAFLAIVLWRSRIWEAGETLGDVSPAILVLVPLLTVISVAPLALRQRAILRALDYRISALALAPIAFYGNTVGFMTPAASGELLRPTLFDRAFGLPLNHGVSVVLFERLYSMGIFLLSGLLAFSLTGVLPKWAAIPMAGLLVVGMFGPLALVRILNIPVARIPSLLPRFVQRRLTGLDEAGEAFERLWNSPRLAVEFVVLSLVTFAIMLAQYWLVVDGTGSEIGLHEMWVVVVAAAMAGMASGMPFGLGAGDAVMVSLLSAYGVDVPAAGAVVILVRALINLPAGLMGLGAYIIALRQGAPHEANGSSTSVTTRLATAIGGNDK
ncbi:MAG: lysylphosphatidylglycerol synthase transmembrane domain-containing protein, partial [Dehalococcoidia bacterium]